ncbi:hypothetical protein PGT21_034120 [Puccinia graminis f. sp. tritici]|uniref:Uncharacterized protein n=2 Tax=Puccinia graminis f. sp. tritici TaxID=56615 RepID=A0A5B0QQT5_PUCGR|nr:hypothetical protein PGT21_034120 [Puccinia graminis f. sp. tritici]
MHLSSRNGHQEVSNSHLRRKKPPALSRPFPPGFTPVIAEVSPSIHRSVNKSDIGPVFLPPALRSPLPPSDESLPMEKQRSRHNRLLKTPISPHPLQKNQAKLIPSIRRICSATRPSQRSPSTSAIDASPPSPARVHSDDTVLHQGPAFSTPITNRLRSVSQHSSIMSRPKLRDLAPLPLPQGPFQNTGDSCRLPPQAQATTKTRLPRIRSISTSLSASPVERARNSILTRRPKDQPENYFNCKPKSVRSVRHLTPEPPTPCSAQMDYTPSSYLCFDSGGSHHMGTGEEVELLNKLPDYTLDNWTGWRKEILLSACDSSTSDEPSILDDKS